MLKKTLIYFFVLGLSSSVFAAQTTLTDMPSLKVGNAINVIGTNVQGNTTKHGGSGAFGAGGKIFGVTTE